MSDTRTIDALLFRRALAEKATPGPWIEKIEEEGDFDDDVTYITTETRQEDSTIEIAKLEYTNPYKDNPNGFVLEQRANATHIAANTPAVVMADIDEILRLRAEVERLEREADWLAKSAANAGWHCVRVSPAFMREQARKAVRERND